MHLRFACELTGAEYVSQSAWHKASLPHCPLHPNGGCGFARHGTYPRVSPPGIQIARWYCPTGHRTFSLLPDCLAARLSGTLSAVVAVVCAAEQAPSLAAACQDLRPDIELPGVLRWARRRVQAVHAALQALKGLYPPHSPVLPRWRRSLPASVWPRCWWHGGQSGHPSCRTCPLRSDAFPGASRGTGAGMPANTVRGLTHRGERLAAKAALDYAIPGSARTRVAAETLRDWLMAYRRGSFDALLPKERADRGLARALPAAAVEALLAAKEGNPKLSVQWVIREARKAPEVPPELPLPSSTVIAC